MTTAATMMMPVSKAALVIRGGKKNGSMTGTVLNGQTRRGSRNSSVRGGAVQVRSDINWASDTMNSGYSNGAPNMEVDPLAVVFVSAEVAPWSKTGGLGDVCGALPIELARRGHKVVTISPRYDQYSDAWDTSIVQDIRIGDSVEQVRYFHTVEKGVHRVWIDNPIFLAKVWGKTKDKLYASSSAMTYADNPKRFILLTKAALEANLTLPFCPGEDCTFIANDWHTALLPAFLKHEYQARGQYKNSKVAFCVHNIAFQGRFKPQQVTSLGVPTASMDSLSFKDGYPEVYDELNPDPRLDDEDAEVMAPGGKKFPKVNWMKSGFILSDLNVTVSPNYAKELVSGPGKGAELDDVIRRSGGIVGIANGMDVTEWAPETDKFLEENYTKESVLEGKAVAKQSLQAEVGLAVDPSIPLIGYIGRLEPQKGVDIMLEALPQICQSMPVQVVILGTGKSSFEEMVEDLETRFPSNARGIVKFSAPLAHMITAGADYLMVPSRFEPCGLIQLHAMQYGTVPMVSTTGGLVDTVKDGITGIHMGAMDPDDVTPADVSNVVDATSRAVQIFQSGQWTEMVRNCITQDLSWKEPAKKWEGIIANLKNPSAGAAAQSQSVRTPQENWTPGYTGPEKQPATAPKAWSSKPPSFAGSVLPTIALPPKVITSPSTSTAPVSVGTGAAPAKLSTVRTSTGSVPTRPAPGVGKSASSEGFKAVPAQGSPRKAPRPSSGTVRTKTLGKDDDKPVQKEGPKPKRS